MRVQGSRAIGPLVRLLRCRICEIWAKYVHKQCYLVLFLTVAEVGQPADKGRDVFGSGPIPGNAAG
jgi:hypothetical protein